MKSPYCAVLLAGFGLGLWAAPVPAAPGDSGQGQPVDRELFKDSGVRPGGEPEKAENPLLAVSREMRKVEGLIGRSECGPPTQQLQGRIVAELAELIQAARKRCGQGSSVQPAAAKAGPRPQTEPPKEKPGAGQAKPGSQPAAVANPQAQGTRSERLSMEQVISVLSQAWGSLPKRERQQMLQLTPPEEFLPKYERLIEDYFKRLAEEKSPRSEN